jgi:hypothetical protein
MEHHRSRAAGGATESEPPQRRPSPRLSESSSPSRDRRRRSRHWAPPAGRASPSQAVAQRSGHCHPSATPRHLFAKPPFGAPPRLSPPSARPSPSSLRPPRASPCCADRSIFSELLPLPPFLHLAPAPLCPSCTSSHRFPRRPAIRRCYCLRSQVLPLLPLVSYPFVCSHLANQPRGAFFSFIFS